MYRRQWGERLSNDYNGSYINNVAEYGLEWRNKLHTPLYLGLDGRLKLILLGGIVLYEHL